MKPCPLCEWVCVHSLWGTGIVVTDVYTCDILIIFTASSPLLQPIPQTSQLVLLEPNPCGENEMLIYRLHLQWDWYSSRERYLDFQTLIHDVLFTKVKTCIFSLWLVRNVCNVLLLNSYGWHEDQVYRSMGWWWSALTSPSVKITSSLEHKESLQVIFMVQWKVTDSSPPKWSV